MYISSDRSLQIFWYSVNEGDYSSFIRIMAYFYYCLVALVLITAVEMRVEMPPECEGKTFCTIKPNTYDHNMLDIDKYASGSDATNYLEMEPIRTGDDDNCWSITEVKVPYIVRVRINSSLSENHLVYQPANKYFQQKIRYTTCLDKGKACLEELAARMEDVETRCEEQYTTITLHVLHGGEIQPHYVDIPVACACKITSKISKK